MKIDFEKIRYKNFLSYGNNFTEIDLSTTGTTCIMGKNGSGKCLRGSTEIEIRFKNKNVESKFKEFLDSQ